MLCFNKIGNDYSKINKIANTFLLFGEKFMPQLHLRQPGFIYSAWGRFTKYCKMIQKFKEKLD